MPSFGEEVLNENKPKAKFEFSNLTLRILSPNNRSMINTMINYRPMLRNKNIPINGVFFDRASVLWNGSLFFLDKYNKI